jgi:hypothetical protein
VGTPSLCSTSVALVQFLKRSVFNFCIDIPDGTWMLNWVYHNLNRVSTYTVLKPTSSGRSRT